MPHPRPFLLPVFCGNPRRFAHGSVGPSSMLAPWCYFMSYCGLERPKLPTREALVVGVDFSNACDGTGSSPSAGRMVALNQGGWASVITALHHPAGINMGPQIGRRQNRELMTGMMCQFAGFNLMKVAW